jgi:hypothetical protein
MRTYTSDRQQKELLGEIQAAARAIPIPARPTPLKMVRAR